MAKPLPFSSSAVGGRKRWSNVVPLLIAFIFIAEVVFLGRLDMVVVLDWANSFHFPTLSTIVDDLSDYRQGDGRCSVDWLEREDTVGYDRDFRKDPILIQGGDGDWSSCSVGCKYGYGFDRKHDGTFDLHRDSEIASIHRSMESSQYYQENDLGQARRSGYRVVMTTSLSSDVPVGYFSWSEYDIMAPLQPKNEEALAAAFISNCGARNFRLQVLEKLEKLNVKIDSYGRCHRNRDGSKVDKMEALKHYKFSLAFENSNEEDYVTEKFFQSLVAGAVPVVVGAPNIHDFAPAPGSILHITQLDEVESVARTMKHLAASHGAYNQTIRWKYEGPSDSFKALVDMSAVHSSCRLCIYLATKIQDKEEKGPRFQKRPCKCTSGSKVLYHLYVRERGKFEFESIFLRSDDLTLKALESAILDKYTSQNYTPVWKQERPEVIRGADALKIYRVYPVGMTQRQALYTFRFGNDADFQRYIKNNPCAKLEVIFV